MVFLGSVPRNGRGEPFCPKVLFRRILLGKLVERDKEHLFISFPTDLNAVLWSSTLELGQCQGESIESGPFQAIWCPSAMEQSGLPITFIPGVVTCFSMLLPLR